MSSLLDDIEAEKHSVLLESGNLPGKAKKLLPPSPKPQAWTGENTWTSNGYLARISRSICMCGAETKILVGIFHKETSPSGAVRLQALVNKPHRFQIPLGENYPLEITEDYTNICPECISTHGFTERPVQ